MLPFTIRAQIVKYSGRFLHSNTTYDYTLEDERNLAILISS